MEDHVLSSGARPSHPACIPRALRVSTVEGHVSRIMLSTRFPCTLRRREVTCRPMAILKFWSRKGLSTTERLTPPTPESRPFAQSLYRLPRKKVAVDLEELRARLRQMTDAELRRFGQAAHYMSSMQSSPDEASRNVFVIQLEECRAEWDRRHPFR